MNSAHLLFAVDQSIATITLNRPEQHNAFDDALIADFISLLKEIETKKEIRVVLLKANGKNFSAGADLAWMQRMADYSEKENIQDAKQLALLMQTLNELSKPTIGLIQGAVFGGGIGLVACCDIAIASSDAVFCFSETKIGLIPAVISPYVIAALGERVARRYFLTAEIFDAKEACRLGLIHQVVEREALEATGNQFSQMLLKNAPQAVNAAKQLILNVARKSIDPALIDYTSKEIARLRVSEEGQERLKSFLEKNT